MKSYIIEFTEEQLSLMARCIEDIHRFATGDMELYNTISVLLQDDKDRTISQSQKCQTFWHEVVHYILDAMGEKQGEDNERFVTCFSNFLNEVIQSCEIKEPTKED